MATPNQDSTQVGVPITVEFTEQGKACLPAPIMEAFQTANWRATFTESGPADPEQAVMKVSDLADNISRLDNQGGIYTPGLTKIEVNEQTVNIGTGVAPGVGTEIAFALPGVADLNNVMLNIDFEVDPPQFTVGKSIPVFTGGLLRYQLYRLFDSGLTAPYTALTVKGRGRVLVIPSPSPT